MTKTIQFRAPIQENEARLVMGMADKRWYTQYELYAYCSDYFWDNYRGVFFADEKAAAEILQNTFIAFWENIERRKIYVEDGIVMGKDNKPLNGSILTYFMSIARNKYLEYGREHPVYADPETELGGLLRGEGFDPNEYIGMLYDSSENMMLEIIADVISHMSPRCSRILTKFYYEEKKLETILKEMPTIESYDALKTKKNKCLKNLRESAREIYHRKLNSQRTMDMDEKFQDRIDNYLLNRMDDAEKARFLREVEQDVEKKKLLEFTQNVKDSIRSREEKLRALLLFQRQHEEERRTVAFRATGTERAACYCPAPEMEERPMQSKKKIELWISGVAVVLVVVGFFAIRPIFYYESSPNYNGVPMEQMREGDEVFSPTPADSTDNDTIKFDVEKEATLDE